MLPEPSLARAAESLAKAAAALTEAAQAMSIAANSFSPQLLAKNPQLGQLQASPTPGRSPLVPHYESDLESSSAEEEDRTEQEESLKSEELANLGDPYHYASNNRNPCHQAGNQWTRQASELGHKDGDLSSKFPPTPHDITQPKTTRPVANVSKSTGLESAQTYHLLLDDEADVLLFMCALVRKRRRVVCYMGCSIPALAFYKTLLTDVTQEFVHIATCAKPKRLERVGDAFLSNQGSILLLSDAMCPNIRSDGPDSWVLHVGWPTDEHHYKAQIKSHGAQNNILIAYSGNRDLYSAGETVISTTKPWPEDSESFRASVEGLRSRYDQKLNLMSPETKAKIYTSWIHYHGPKGHRYVTSWSPSDLAHHANCYLLDVLKYHTRNSQGLQPAQTPLPTVSFGFVKDNDLQAAVEAGVLQLKPRSTSSNQAATSSGGDHASSSIIPRIEGRGLRPTSLREYIGHFTTKREKTPELGFAASTGTFGNSKFKRTMGQRYFTIMDEFDAIPLIGFLVLSSAYDRTVVFLGNYASLTHYKKLIEKIIGYRYSVIIPNVGPGQQDKSYQDAALQLTGYVSRAVLLLPYQIAAPPPVLTQSIIGQCIFWGGAGFAPTVETKMDLSQISCHTTSIIMTKAQEDAGNFANDIQKHPSSEYLCDLSSNSWLSPMRRNIKSALIAHPDISEGLYEAYVELFAKLPRTTSSIEVAQQLNEFATRVLLRGNKANGSRSSQPLGGSYPISAEMIRSYDLQAAVDARLLFAK